MPVRGLGLDESDVESAGTVDVVVVDGVMFRGYIREFGLEENLKQRRIIKLTSSEEPDGVGGLNQHSTAGVDNGLALVRVIKIVISSPEPDVLKTERKSD